MYIYPVRRKYSRFVLLRGRYIFIRTYRGSASLRYYAQHSDSGNLIAIGIGLCGVEITEAEYTRLLAEIREKAALVDKLYSGEITIVDVQTDWQEEIQRRVDERIAAEDEDASQEISGDELMNMIEEVL